MDKTCKFHELWLNTELIFGDNPKAYGKILEGTSFMLTADPPTEWRHSSPTPNILIFITVVTIFLQNLGKIKFYIWCFCLYIFLKISSIKICLFLYKIIKIYNVNKYSGGYINFILYVRNDYAELPFSHKTKLNRSPRRVHTHTHTHTHTQETQSMRVRVCVSWSAILTGEIMSKSFSAHSLKLWRGQCWSRAAEGGRISGDLWMQDDASPIKHHISPLTA